MLTQLLCKTPTMPPRMLLPYSFKEGGGRISPTWVLKHGETGDFNAVIGGSLPLQYWPTSAGAGLSSREIRGRG